MIFTKRKRPSQGNPSVKLKDHQILPSSSVRFLGIVLDSKLSGKKHMEQATSKGKRLNSILSALRGTWWGANPNLLSIYKSMIRASFEYASLIFALNDNRSLIKLQRVQNQALRLACGYRNSTPINVMHAETKVPLLIQRFEYLAAKYFLKIISIQDHPVVNELLELHDRVINTPQFSYLRNYFPAALIFLRM